MKISLINNVNSNFNFKNKKQCNNFVVKEKFYKDNFKNNNIKSIEFNKNDFLQTIVFNKQINLLDAILSLVNTNNKKLLQAMLYKMHTLEELEGMALDIEYDKFLRNLKVNKLIGMGAFALVFEMDNGKVLKLTDGEHFLDKRKPDFFDLPIEKQGKSCRTFYYIEEKINQDNITQEELKDFINKIKEKGYVLKDIYQVYNGELDFSKIRKDQFGKTKNGELYLVDPGCVLPLKKVNFFKKLFSIFKNK